MALGTTAALMLAGGAFSATSSVMAGQAQASATKKQANYNAEVYEQQAEMIKERQKISDLQFIRNSASARSKMVSATAGKGLMLSGSPLAIMIDNESQMQFDAAIDDYNTQINQNYLSSAAINTRQTGAAQARLSAFTGYSNAFSTILNTGATMGMLNMKIPNAYPITMKGGV